MEWNFFSLFLLHYLSIIYALNTYDEVRRFVELSISMLLQKALICVDSWNEREA